MPPWLILALLISLALALAYQIVSRRFGWRILAYWTLTFAGFIAAEMLSELLGWNVTRLGDLRLLPDLAGALLTVALLWLLGV